MEPSPDLIAARAAWRDALVSRESFSDAHLRELEAHLDDAMDDLVTRGLTTEEAFLIATRRLGAPEPLAAEFRKAGGDSVWAGRARWMLLGILVYLGSAAVAQVLNVVGALLPVVWPRSWLAQFYGVFIYPGAAAAGVWFLSCCLRGQIRWLPGASEGWSPLKTSALLVFWVLVFPILLKSMVNSLAQHFSIQEQLGYSPSSVLDRNCLLNTALFFCPLLVLVLLLRRYWRLDRPVEASE